MSKTIFSLGQKFYVCVGAKLSRWWIGVEVRKWGGSLEGDYTRRYAQIYIHPLPVLYLCFGVSWVFKRKLSNLPIPCSKGV